MKSEYSDFSHLPLLAAFEVNSLFFPRYQDLLSFRKASMPPSLQSEKKTGQDRYEVPQLTCSQFFMPSCTGQGCPNSGQEQNDCNLSFTTNTAVWVFSPLQSHRSQQSPAEEWPCSNNHSTTVGTTGNQVVPKPKVVVVLSGGVWKLLI